jgi:hypothetical protein
MATARHRDPAVGQPDAEAEREREPASWPHHTDRAVWVVVGRRNKPPFRLTLADGEARAQ